MKAQVTELNSFVTFIEINNVGFSRVARQLFTSQLVLVHGIILLPSQVCISWGICVHFFLSLKVPSEWNSATSCQLLPSLIPTKVYSHCARSYCPCVWWMYWLIWTLVSLEYISCCWLPAGYWVIDYCPLSPTIQPIFGLPKSPFVQTIFLQLAVENAVGENVRRFTKN